jgi:biopolymer transport protein ExbD
MRFQRNVKIFRGGVDAAPFAGFFFVVLMFMLLFYSHVFIPGVPIQLVDDEGPPEPAQRTVKVEKSGRIEFLGSTFDFDELPTEIQARARKGTLPQRVILESDAGAPRALVEKTETTLQASGISIKYPGTRLDPPEDAGFTGARNPVLVVGVNLNGQVFFQHQRIEESALQRKLADAVENSREKLTLVLQLDAKVPAEKITRLSEIARRAGIQEVRIGVKPRQS